MTHPNPTHHQRLEELMKELEDIGEFINTTCTYEFDTIDYKTHPHEEYWVCNVCMQKKVDKLLSSIKALLKLREALEWIENHDFACIGDVEGCSCHECTAQQALSTLDKELSQIDDE